MVKARKDSGNPFLEVLLRWRLDPLCFVQEAFGATPEPFQADLLNAYGRMIRHEVEERGLSVASCFGPGKTCSIAWLAWHNILCVFPSRTAITAPSKQTAFDAFFAEFHHWGAKLAPDVRGLVDITGDGAHLIGTPPLYTEAKDAFLTIKTARKENPEAIQGVHSDEGRVLVLVDEASAVDDEVFVAGRSSMSGKNAYTVLISNPTRRTGYFFDTHNSLKGLWFTKQVKWSDSTRCDPRFEEETRLTYGEDSNEYRVYCLGQFPTQDDDAIIAFDLIDAATKREVIPHRGTPVVWGLDVARSLNKDRSALCKRQGNKVLEPVTTWRLDDEMVLCGTIANLYRETPAAMRPVEILIDSIGVGGGVVDRLNELGLPVRGINVSELPSFDGQGKYSRLRDELWYRARQWFMERNGSIPAKDTALIEELQLPCREWDSAGDKIKVEAKEKTKKRGKHISPDVADAFVLTFASDAAAIVGGSKGAMSSNWKEPLRRNLRGLV